MPACYNGNVLHPTPQPMLERVKREPVDHIYDCRASYPASYDISACSASTTTPAYISKLVADVGTSGAPSVGTWSNFSSAYGCNLSGSTALVVPVGNWHIDCAPTLTVNRPLVFSGGNIVADRGISINSGSLLLNTANTDDTYTGVTSSGEWPANTNIDINEHSNQATYIFMRNGQLSFSGTALDLRNTAIYLSDTSNLSLSGSSTGTFTWTAPTRGPLTDLALWANGTPQNTFSGGATMDLEGAFFAPLSTIRYTGGGGGAVEAQFVARRLQTSGNGVLTLVPTRGVPFRPGDPQINLIR